jgi:hypothetical protein
MRRVTTRRSPDEMMYKNAQVSRPQLKLGLISMKLALDERRKRESEALMRVRL